MPGTSNINTLGRIEDFTALAEAGQKVKASVQLREQAVTQKVHPEETEEMKYEIEMYILFGDFTFTVGTEEKTISKSYVYGSYKESLNESKINKNIANERLKMDYKRMGDAKIDFKAKFF